MRWKISFLSFLWSASVSADAWAWESAFKGTPWEKVEATVTVEDTDPHTGQGQITVALPGDAANYCTGVRWRLFDYWTAELTASERETQPVAGGKTTWTIPVTADDGPYVRLCLEAQDRAGRWWPNCHYLTLSDFTGPRRRMTLDGAWQVLKLGPDQPLQSPITLGTLGTSEGWETLTIPEDICSNATNSAAGKRAWYRRPFTPPETLLSNGRATPPCRLFLGFQGAGFHALVYLNGEQVGEHWLCYLPWEADVTGQVQWGQENELLVGLESVRHAHGSLPFTRDWNGGIYDSVYLVARPAVRVERVRVQPAWRQRRLKIETVLRNDTDAAVKVQLRQVIQEAGVPRRSLPAQTVAIPANQTVALTRQVGARGLPAWWPHRPRLLTLQTVIDDHGGLLSKSGKVFSTGCPNWFGDGPQQVETSGTNGRPNWFGDGPQQVETSGTKPSGFYLDEHRERFGYRDFYACGTEFYLNGVRCPLRRFTACVQHWKQGRSALWRHFQGGLRSGFNSLRFHQCPGSFGGDVADEVGLLICQEGSGGVRVEGTGEPSEEWWRHFRDYWQQLADTCSNHPSVVLYSLANEWFYAQELKEGPSQEKMVQLSRDLLRFDPTRPVYMEGMTHDGDGPSRMEVWAWHYPWKSTTYLPEEAEEPFQSREVRGWPGTWQRDRPLMLGEYMCQGCGTQVPAVTAMFGEQPYLSQADTLRAARDTIRLATDIWRSHRLAGLNPWYHLPDSGQVLPPMGVLRRDYFGNWWGGEEAAWNLTLANETLEPAALTLTWTLQDEAGKISGRGQHSLEMAAGELRPWRLKVPLPRVREATAAALELTVRRGRERIYAERHAVHLWPRQRLQVPEGLAVGACGLTSSEQSALHRAGVRVLPLEFVSKPKKVLSTGGPNLFGGGPQQVETSRTKLLGFYLIPPSGGPPSLPLREVGLLILKSGGPPPLTETPPSLLDWVSGGGRVLVLGAEQDLPWLPVPVAVHPHPVTACFARSPHHPLLRGLMRPEFRSAEASASAEFRSAEASASAWPQPWPSRWSFDTLSFGDPLLRWWRPNHLVARHCLAKPTDPLCQVLLDAGGRQGLTECVLAEERFGRGSFLICQLDLLGRLDQEPAAGQLWQNALDYAAQPGEEPTETALLLPVDHPEAEAVEEWGLLSRPLPAPPDPPALAGCTLAVVSAAHPAFSAWAPALRDWVRGGGRLVLRHVTASNAEAAGALLDRTPQVEAVDNLWWARRLQPDPALDGLSQMDFFRGRFATGSCLCSRRQEWPLNVADPEGLLASLTVQVPGGEALTDPPVLVKVPLGQGEVVVDLIHWTGEGDPSPEGAWHAVTLLRNLGGYFLPRRRQSATLRSFTPLDLSAVVNARLTTDLTGETAPAGPWPDGPNNLADLGMGRHEFAGVPFEIQGLTILYSNPHAASQPKSVRVPVNAPADGLVFLHACGWDAPGEVLARYVVRYADGRQKRVPVREGVHLTNWWSENRSLAGAQLAWRGRSEAHEPCCLYAMPWDNPWPDQTLIEIEAESGSTQAFLILAGITLGRK